ncbi:MAG: phosphoadenosine phosphosulfate reductase family protein, partial [Candidatus Aenigmarchaeota archaeon]|nr:phosphoadenosine phosphosulfate reductase family protein [Candidatus Aenigmarchaeota archaeon]
MMKVMASVSGGKDSVAMALRLWELGYKFTIVSVFTEFEFPAIKQQVYKLVKLTCLPHIILETPRGTWDKWFYGKITKGKLKGQVRGVRFILNKSLPNCWYRREAKEKLLRKVNERFDIVYVGIRYDERNRAKEKPKFKYPLIEWKWTERDVKRYLKEKCFWIREYDLFPHTGCFLCPYQTKKAWLVLK